jgi:hypothetical protein
LRGSISIETMRWPATNARVRRTEQIATLDRGDSSEERRQGWSETFDWLEAEV